MLTKNQKPRFFSMRARLKSFVYAIEGLSEFFKAHHNAVIHLFMTMLVFIALFLFRLPKTELVAVILATGFVWAAELFNTAVERLCDVVSKDFDPNIKFIKDVSAAAVLVAAITAFFTGAVIFLPKILS